MDWGSLTEVQLDRIIARSEQEIAGWRVVEMAAIREKRARQSHHADGYRSLVDWVAARADVSHQTSRSLCWTATRLEDAPEIVAQLESGEITFDRAEQLARLPKDKREGHESYDISQLRRLVAHYRRVTPKREKKNGSFLNSNRLSMRPRPASGVSLPGSTPGWWRRQSINEPTKFSDQRSR